MIDIVQLFRSLDNSTCTVEFLRTGLAGDNRMRLKIIETSHADSLGVVCGVPLEEDASVPALQFRLDEVARVWDENGALLFVNSDPGN